MMPFYNQNMKQNQLLPQVSHNEKPLGSIVAEQFMVKWVWVSDCQFQKVVSVWGMTTSRKYDLSAFS